MAYVPYASVVGSLMYVMVCTQPDISHAVGVLRSYIPTPRKEHWTTTKIVFSYLCGMKDYVISYQGRPGGDNVKLNIHGFVDTDWVGELDRWRSNSGYVFNMFDGEIRWMSKRHVLISLSTIEIEYMETTHGRKKKVWLQRMCSGIKFRKRAMKVSCNSQIIIFLAQNPLI
jgi:hypothetical protein